MIHAESLRGEAADAALRTSLERVRSEVSYLRADVGASAKVSPEADGAWLPARRLIEDPHFLAKTIHDSGRRLGTERAVVAASLFVQGYTYRLVTMAVASASLAGVLPDSRPDGVDVALRGGRPFALRYRDVSVLRWPGASEGLRDAALRGHVLSELLDGAVVSHLGELVTGVRASTRIGARLLWGNVAASCAVAFRTVEPLAGPFVRDVADEFFRLAPAPMRGLGSFLVLENGQRHGWFWERTTCCLYDTLGGVRCADCSKTPTPERRDAYRRSLQDD